MIDNSCVHFCKCSCHDPSGPRKRHIVACCYPCLQCNAKIKSASRDSHMAICHPSMEDIIQ